MFEYYIFKKKYKIYDLNKIDLKFKGYFEYYLNKSIT